MKKPYNFYSIKWGRSKSGFNWTPPFIAPDDGIALNALLEMVNKCPDLQRKYLCRIGTFDPSTGTIKGHKPVIVRAPKVKKENKHD